MVLLKEACLFVATELAQERPNGAAGPFLHGALALPRQRVEHGHPIINLNGTGLFRPV